MCNKTNLLFSSLLYFFFAFMSKYFLTNPFLEIYKLHIWLHRLLWGNGGDRFHLAGSPAIWLGYPITWPQCTPCTMINLSRKASSSDWSFSIDPFSIETFLRMSVGHQVGEVGGLQAWAATNSDTWIGPVTRWQFKAVSKINIHQIFQHMYLFTCHCQSMSITSKKVNPVLWLWWL